MKAKTFIACAFAASALPLSSAWAVMPTGPQGTGAYGAPNAAAPLPQTVPPGYVYPGPYSEAQTVAPIPDNSVTRDALSDQQALDRDPPRRETRRPTRNWVHQGPSWATNPPAPA